MAPRNSTGLLVGKTSEIVLYVCTYIPGYTSQGILCSTSPTLSATSDRRSCRASTFICMFSPMPMGKRSINKKFEFQKHPPKIFMKALPMGTFRKKNPNFWKSPKKEKRKSGADVGRTSAPEKLRPILGSKQRNSESVTDIDRQNQRLRHEF